MEAGHWPVVNRKSHCGANQSKSRINSAFESSLWIFSEFLSILILWLRESQFYDSQIFIFLNQKNFSRLDLLNAQERQKRQMLATKINGCRWQRKWASGEGEALEKVFRKNLSFEDLRTSRCSLKLLKEFLVWTVELLAEVLNPRSNLHVLHWMVNRCLTNDQNKFERLLVFLKFLWKRSVKVFHSDESV